MLCILRPDENDIPEWVLFDEQWLLTRYNGELSPESVTQAIYRDFGEHLAITIGYSE